MTSVGRAALAVAVAVLAGGLGVRPGGAGEIASVAVDHLGIRGGGVHQIWVVVLDDRGMPVRDLPSDRFTVSVDGQPADLLKVTPPPGEGALEQLTLLVDPALETASSFGLRTSAFAVDQALPASARLQVVVMGERWPGVTARGEALTRGLDALVGRGGLGTRARVYDGLDRELRRARGPTGRGTRAVLVLTRGVDDGSGHDALEVLTLVDEPRYRIPVGVMLCDPERALETAQLRQLAERSGGALAAVPHVGALETVVPRLLARAGGAYRVQFRPRGWDAGSGMYHLTVGVNSPGRSRSITGTFVTEDARIAPAWRDARIWLTLVALVVLATALVLLLRPRRLFVLVVGSERERGFSYEVYAVPVSIGATDANDLVFPEAQVSRNHAVLVRRGRQIEIVDLNSENGTFVNDLRVERQALTHGDRISLGRVVDLSFVTRN
jgi:hypothetical protein